MIKLDVIKSDVSSARYLGVQIKAPRLQECARREMPPSFDHLSDALRRAALGDKLAFDQLYLATRVKLYGIILRILKRRDHADEVLQDVYIKIWRSAGSFDPSRASPIAWMAVIARNHALDELKRKPMLSIEDFPEILEIADGKTPHDDLDARQDSGRLLRALEHLDPKQRTSLMLAYFHGLTREEIAQKLDVPASTVKTWIRRGLDQLKERLG